MEWKARRWDLFFGGGAVFSFLFYFLYFLYLHFKCYPKSSLYPHPAPLPTHSHFLALVFPCTEAYKVCASLYCCSPYRAANWFSSFSPFYTSFIGDPKLSLMDVCEHPHLYMSGSDRASQETAILRLLSGSTCWHLQLCLGLVIINGMDPHVSQSLDDYFFSLYSTLCLCNSFYG
jgi:hypothetical protein